MVNLALFGAGRIGKIHGRSVVNHADACLTALYDPFDDNANALAAELSCLRKTPAAIFADPSIDGVLICSATDTHADLIEQAIAAGKHVFCEKPIDLSLARVEQVVAKVADSDLVAMVAFNRRFDPNFALLQQRIANGDIGDVELVSIISKDPAPPPIDYIKVSGGLFRDMTIHDFDMARFLLGEEIVSVSAHASCSVDPEIGAANDVDTAVINMQSRSGKLVQISNSRRASFGYDQRFEVHASNGMLTASNQLENTITGFTKSGVNSAKPMHFFLERYAHAYAAEMDAFVRAIQGQRVDVPSMHDGLQALKLAEAAITSVATGRRIDISV